MECTSYRPESQKTQRQIKTDKSKSQQSKENTQLKKEIDITKKPPPPQKQRTSKSSAKEERTLSKPEGDKLKTLTKSGSADTPANKSSLKSRTGDKERSDKSRCKDSKKHSHRHREGKTKETGKIKKDEGQKKTERGLMESEDKTGQERRVAKDDDDGGGDGSEEDEDEIDTLQKRLAALNRELTSLSDDDESERKNSAEKEEKNDDSEMGRDSQSRNDDQSTTTRCQQEDKRSNEVTEVKGQETDKSTTGDNSGDIGEHGNTVTDTSTERKDSTTASVKCGKLKIKPEEFKRRHINQLFIRGDNVVLVSVESNLLPR